ncbi:CPBP family intramembrane glutamic endopeptidase [Glaciecola sp. 1036]|uniref:CPBP family intramembrane glutamic endopeptidase n=1 Tax=Alteromonadaceae TaxID=72275 RepID=UPI003D04E4E1
MEIQLGEWILFITIIAMVIYSLWESDKEKLAVISGRKTKIQAYKSAMLFMWLPTALLIYLIFIDVLRLSDLGLYWQGDIKNWLGLVFTCVTCIYFGYSVYIVATNPVEREAFREVVSDNHDWMLPSNRTELQWFIGGLSTSAGICEELLFRGFMIGVLDSHIGLIPSLLLSSAIFGLCHFYQGWKNVVRTGCIGLILGGIFIITESLWVIILLHTVIDVYGGLVGYILNNSQPNPTERYFQ